MKKYFVSIFWVFVWAGLQGQSGQHPTLRPYPEPELHIPEPGEFEFNTANFVYRATAMFLSGACEGVAETLKFRYNRFERIHPGAPANRWNPEISWKGKYKNGDPAQGPAFFGSTTFLVWTTDRYHLFRTASRVSGAVGLTIPVWEGSGKKLRHYAAEVGGSFLVWSAGFHTTYSLIYR